jgi:hypothetical protein
MRPDFNEFIWTSKLIFSKIPDKTIQDIIEILHLHEILYNRRDKFLLSCFNGNFTTGSLVEWEIEICKDPHRLSYVRFKRISGNLDEFRIIVSLISDELESRLHLDNVEDMENLIEDDRSISNVANLKS